MPDVRRTYTSVLTETAIRFAHDMERMADLSARAFRVHFEALMWCTLNGFPLRVAKVHVPEFARSEDPAPAVAELVGLGWWVEDGDFWTIDAKHSAAEDEEDARDAEAALEEGGPMSADELWASLGIGDGGRR